MNGLGYERWFASGDIEPRDMLCMLENIADMAMSDVCLFSISAHTVGTRHIAASCDFDG